MKCPRCKKNDIRPYGYIKVRNHGFVEKVRRYRCEDCLKQFTKNSHKKESIW
jgi:transposase-like protein